MSVMSVSVVRADGAGSGSDGRKSHVRQIATRDNTERTRATRTVAHISTSRRHETHLPIPDEMDWKHWFSNLMAEGDANERLKREDPAAYEAKMRAQLPTSTSAASAARPSRATATAPPCSTRAWRATRATARSCCPSASASGRRERRSRPERDRRPVVAGSALRCSGLGLGRARVGLAERAAGP